jgi:hypothetical protein
MLRNLWVVIALLSMLSYAASGTVSIGTANTRGEMRVDNYMVKGNATLFDGSVVETGQTTADLRLDKGTEITMSTSSQGALYRNHLVLQQGESELATSSSFQIEADGLRVTPNKPNSRGVVSMKPGNMVEVAALTGSFGITNDHGVLLASVRPGGAVSFATQAGTPPMSFEGTGMVSYENGHYYLTTDADIKYELTCKDFKQYVGTKSMVISGTVQAVAVQTASATATICVNSIEINGGTGISSNARLIIGGVIVGTGVGAAVGFYEVNKSSTPASR